MVILNQNLNAVSKLHTGIFGPSLSGKTTLAKFLSKDMYRRHKIESLVLDPIGDDWGEHAQVFTATEEEQFWTKVWSSKRKAVFVDEGTEMIGRDKDLIPAFTRIRHQQHKLFVIGHRGNSLLPVMRDQISTLFLFRQTEKAAEIWVEQFTNEDIIQSTTLGQYEFIWVDMFGPVRKMKLPNPNKAPEPVKNESSKSGKVGE